MEPHGVEFQPVTHPVGWSLTSQLPHTTPPHDRGAHPTPYSGVEAVFHGVSL